MKDSIKQLIRLIFICSIFNSCSAQTNSEEKERHNTIIRALNDTIAECKVYNSAKQLIQLSFYNRNQELHGKFYEWYENGQIKLEWNYKNNKLHGKILMWDENGMVSLENNYKLGLMDGYQATYKNGDTLAIEYYSEGELISRKEPIDFYQSPTIMLKNLMKQGLDSATAFKILKNDLSGYIIKKDEKTIFVEDENVKGLIGDVMTKTDAIEINKFNTPLSIDYLKSKGLTQQQIDYLIDNNFIKLRSEIKN